MAPANVTNRRRCGFHIHYDELNVFNITDFSKLVSIPQSTHLSAKPPNTECVRLFSSFFSIAPLPGQSDKLCRGGKQAEGKREEREK